MPDYNPQIDYYEILQVHPHASGAVIKAAYRVILRELRAHPDLGGREDFAKVLNEAYRVLGNSELRLAYDGARLLVTAKQVEHPGLEQVVTCPRCGKSNTLPLGTDTRSARCSFCGVALHKVAAPPSKQAAERRENVFDLPPDEYRALCRQSQSDRRVERVAEGDVLRCRFCGNEWAAKKSGRPPRTCPTCLRVDWHAFRMLKCRVCGYEWRSSRLARWTYRDHPRCPNCANPRWSNYCESHPLRWFLGLLPG